MIGKLTGIVDELYSDSLVLSVGGVGYLIYSHLRALRQLSISSCTTFWIETYLRQDIIQLYGFLSNAEKSCFLLLTQVSGIGPRLALAILSTLAPCEIKFGIETNAKEIFKGIHGLGPKLIDRMFLELKSKISQLDIDSSVTSDFAVDDLTHTTVSMQNDAVAALVSLGVNKNDAQNRVSTTLKDYPEVEFNDLIKMSLRK